MRLTHLMQGLRIHHPFRRLEKNSFGNIDPLEIRVVHHFPKHPRACLSLVIYACRRSPLARCSCSYTQVIRDTTLIQENAEFPF